MRRLLWALAVLLCIDGLAQAETKRGPWLRRVTLAASCASSLWDLQTTRTAIGYGAQEANPLFVNRGGEPRWSRMVGVKVGLCAGMAVGQELLDRNRRSTAADYAWSSVNVALAIRHSAASRQNLRVAREMKGRPEYLLKHE
jgi:hypothetical protein